MFINCQDHTSSQLYFLLTQTVVPRPIAWVLSDNGNGSYNLAPFSFFNAVTSNPPIVMLSIGWKDDTTRKDSWVNIDERSEFVVHIPSVGSAHSVVATSATLPHGVSELDGLDLPVEATAGMKLPRVVGPKIALFCEKYKIIEVGEDQQGLILGKVHHVWIDESIVKTDQGRIIVDPQRLDPLARLGGNYYAPLGKAVMIKRPA